jgi:hypothetical protein
MNDADDGREHGESSTWPTRATASCRRGPTSVVANVDLEVHRTLDRNSTKISYLVRQLSVYVQSALAYCVGLIVLCCLFYKSAYNLSLYQ